MRVGSVNNCLRPFREQNCPGVRNSPTIKVPGGLPDRTPGDGDGWN